MDIFDKYAQYAQRHAQLLALGADPFAVQLDDLHSATEADVGGRTTILAGTNNYLGLTYDPDCIAAAEALCAATGPARRARASPTAPTRSTRTWRPFARFLGKRSCMVFSTGYKPTSP